MINFSFSIGKLIKKLVPEKDNLIGRVEKLRTVACEMVNVSQQASLIKAKELNDPFLPCLQMWQKCQQGTDINWGDLEKNLLDSISHDYKPIRITAIGMAIMSFRDDDNESPFRQKVVQVLLDNRYFDYETRFQIAFAAGFRLCSPEMIDWLLLKACSNPAPLRLNLKSLKKKESEGEMRILAYLSLNTIYTLNEINDASKVIAALQNADWNVRKVAVSLVAAYKGFDKAEMRAELESLQKKLEGDLYYQAIWLKKSVDDALNHLS